MIVSDKSRISLDSTARYVRINVIKFIVKKCYVGIKLKYFKRAYIFIYSLPLIFLSNNGYEHGYVQTVNCRLVKNTKMHGTLPMRVTTYN